MRFCILYILVLSIILSGCQKTSPSNELFVLLPSDETGVEFSNAIIENDTFNILTQEYIYNGGGVAVADFNNDGLQDLFFSGNSVENALYINKGDLKFSDVTKISNVNVPGRWNSGVSVVDINQDGLMDIYISVTLNPDKADRKNILFINLGFDKDGIPKFQDKAAEYGVDDDGYSVSSAFFDYDRDGDLDLYVLTNERLNNFPSNYRTKIVDGTSPNNDRLYRNNGNGTFTNVSKEAGVVIEGFGLGLAISDINQDGWPDIYVSNDYLSNDLLYINQKDGTFKNKIAEYIGHQSQFSMGSDVVDINNDALPDIITLDMLPETNNRKKTTISNKNYLNNINTEKFGYEYQYVRNMLHVNNGLSKNIKFSEVGFLTGVHQTEWSWGPLFADFDNDGNKDLMITNGFPKDITDKDFANYRADVGSLLKMGELEDSIPIVKISNYAFQNKGNLVFTDVSNSWGLDHPSFSNGAAYSDLDNDGDLDYVVSNINDKAFIYKNTLYDVNKVEPASHFLRIKFKNDAQHSNYGAKVLLKYKGKIQYNEQGIHRGYLSTVEDVIHFGVGGATQIDTVLIQWANGGVKLLKNVKADQVLTIAYDSADANNSMETSKFLGTKEVEALFKQEENLVGDYVHKETDWIDYNIQRTIPHKFSQDGPSLAVADVNGDNLEDFYSGGSVGNDGSIFLQQKSGSFKEVLLSKSATKKEEDSGALFFDADNDGDVDLYVVAGGFQYEKNSPLYQDRFYRNDGRGNFTLQELPPTLSNGSCVKASDFDRDGDLDLFVGGRVRPAGYPFSDESYILKNDNGKFTNVTENLSPDITSVGMVTDALWSDFNNDGQVDLIVVGEFMSITMFRNDKGKFVKQTETGLENYTGWWNSIAGADMDSDGDIDYVAGNLGVNNFYGVSEKAPLNVTAKDFDSNGSIDAVLACYGKSADGLFYNYPVHFWDELNSQSPKFRKKFTRYRQYGNATLDQLLSKENLDDALVLKANYMSSSYIENLGNGKFKISALPMWVLVAPVKGIVISDVNGDGKQDIIMVGNEYGNEVFVGRYDAFTGLVLLGDGKGNFKVIPSAESGFYVPGDAKALVRLKGVKGDLFIASQNRDRLKVFAPALPKTGFTFKPEPLDNWAELIYTDGRKQKTEFYYGSGYLSQSTRSLRVDKNVKEIIVYDSKGKSRKIVPNGI